MAVFFELTTDVFQERFDSVVKQRGRRSAGALSVRRPLRGLEVKEETYAMIKVVDMLGREIKLYDGGSFTGKTTKYTNFILQAVQETRAEKFQLAETFGDPYIFLFGESPRFLDCSAVLINSADFNWQNEFWVNYDQYLRGTKCAENGTRIYLFYDDVIVEGYMLTASASRESSTPMMVPLQFRLFLTNHRNVSMVGDPNFPIRLGIDIEAATQNVQTINEDGSISMHPQRGLTFENADEWTGTRPPVEPDDDDQQLDDLIQAAVVAAAENAANMNHVDTLANTGLIAANSGGGTGGTVPRTTNAPTSDSSTTTTSGDGLQCVAPTPVDPTMYPGATTGKAPDPPAQPQSVYVTDNGGTSGAFTSTPVPNSSECLDSSCSTHS